MRKENEIRVQPRSRRGSVAFLGAVAGNWILAFTSYVLLSWFTQDGFSGSPVMLLLLKLPEGAVLGSVSALCQQHFKYKEFDKAVSLSVITGVLVLSFSLVFIIWGNGDFAEHEKRLWFFLWGVGSLLWSAILLIWGVRQYFRLRQK